MPAFSIDAFSTDAFSTDAFSLSADAGTEITNAAATADTVPNNYEICQQAGFKVLPHHIVKDVYGHFVRAESRDSKHPQDMVRSRGGDKQHGPRSPELDDSFISTAVSPNDL